MQTLYVYLGTEREYEFAAPTRSEFVEEPQVILRLCLLILP